MKAMRNWIVCAFIAFLLTACGGGSNGSNDGTTPPVATDPSLNAGPQPLAGTFGDGRLVELVEWSRASHGVPGMGVVIVQQGAIAEMAASGLRSVNDSEAITTGDQWHLGSLTKAITATLAGVLVELSVIEWETRPLDVWPELAQTIHPSLRNVTLRNLLSHTSGVRRVNSAPSQYGDSAVGTVREKRKAMTFDLLSEFPIGPVGEENYSNGGYIVAGAMLEERMSLDWETLVQDYVFAPLGMTESGFGAPIGDGILDQPLGHWSEGVNYLAVQPGPDADNPAVFGPAGTVHATMADYAKFMIAHIDGARGNGGIVTAELFDALHSPVVGGSALGWGVRQSDADAELIELVHAGSNLRWYSFVRLVPDLNVGVLYVVNAGGEFSSSAVNRLDALLEERFENSR